ncbi:MAG: hypothetical protein R6U50_04820 [Desulfobacterales bacterium]
MEKKIFLKMLGQIQGIRLDNGRVDRFLEPGRTYDQVQFIKSALYTFDVQGYRPGDEPDFSKGDHP